MKQGLVRLLYNSGKRFMGWTLHMIMCVLLCYPVSIHMSQLLSTGRPISSSNRSCLLVVVPIVLGIVTQIVNTLQFLLFHSSAFKSAKHFGHSFAFDAPKIWNELPQDIRSATSVASFRKKLKTYLFAKAYPP